MLAPEQSDAFVTMLFAKLLQDCPHGAPRLGGDLVLELQLFP